jgi:hypothetical protein
VIDSRFVVSDDYRRDLLIFGEFPEERFTLFRIERDSLLRGRFTELGGSLVGGELSEQGDALDEIVKEIVALSRV